MAAHPQRLWTTGVFDANGISIHYLRTGGFKPPVVLLHGLTGNAACWTPLARALADEYDLVMPDARGHGSSSKPCGGYRYEDYAGDAVGLVQGLGLVGPVLLGHSMGGMTAAMVACQLGPSVRGVILVDPTFMNLQQQRAVYESDAVEQHRRLLGLDKGDVLAQARMRHPHRSPEIIELVTKARLQTRPETFDVLEPPNPNYQQLLSTLDVPILLIIADSGVVSLDTAQALQELNPLLRLDQIQDAGHAIPYDQPERFETAVRSFLTSVGLAVRAPIQ